MSYQLNEKIRGLTPYDPISGSYRIRLDANESFLDTAALLGDKVQQAVAKAALNRYPDPYAVRLVEKFSDYYHLDPQTVCAGNGSDELIGILVAAFMEKGDKLLTTAPDFSMYRFYASIYEDVNVIQQKNDALEIQVDALIDRCNREGAKMLVFSNPCNPTSLALKREEVLRLVKSVSALVVVDEAYMDFADSSLYSVLDCAGKEEYSNLVVLKTCSKALGCAGIRLGFTVSTLPVTNAVKAVKSPYNVNSVTQAIGEVLFGEPRLLDEGIRKLKDAREDLYRRILALQSRYPMILSVCRPQTNFVFLKIGAEDNGSSGAARLFQGLLDRSIAVRHMGDFLRISAGSPEENEALERAMDDILREMSC